MPYIQLNEEADWSEDEPVLNSKDFQYLLPPDFGGSREPVKFTTAKPGTRAARKQVNVPKVSWKLRLLMWFLGKILPGMSQVAANSREHFDQAADRRAALFSTLVPALQSIGGLRVRCVYDGGNDEGFAWFDYLETANENLPIDDVVTQLKDTDVVAKLVQAKVIRERGGIDAPGQLEEEIKYSLADEWAALLLGSSYGTGGYTMYGAFDVDLDKCTINDDRNAGVPRDGNVMIEGGD